MNFKSFLLSIIFIFVCNPSWALFTELGLTYNYKKTSFDSTNNVEQQASTGSVSLYFWEKVALELSYTSGLYVKKELQPTISTPNSLTTTTQYTDVYETNLIFVFADKKAAVQPFLKAGTAYVKKRQVVLVQNNSPWEIKSEGVSPSYGAGLKFFITEAFAVRLSYDLLKTPIDSGGHVDDITGRAGISWMF